MILVTGANGQLGSEICRRLEKSGKAYLGVDREDLDLTDAGAVAAFFETHPQIDSVLHCAAYTAVDRAEDERDLCFAVNRDATATLARLCGDTKKLLYVSTDYVFGSDDDRFHETDDEKCPLSVYGQSKSAGEDAVKAYCKRAFIVRTSWVFGERDTNFIATMLRLAKTHDTLSVVSDQIGSPTDARDLAALLCEMIGTEKYGVYHATNEGVCSWFELACDVFRLAKKNVRVFPVTTAQYGAKAPRPLNSRLSKQTLDRAGFSRLRPWQDAVRDYVESLTSRMQS